MKLNEEYGVDYDWLRKTVDDINEKYYKENGHSTKRLLMKWGHVLEFAETNGIDWIVAIRIECSYLKKEKRDKIINDIAKTYFKR